MQSDDPDNITTQYTGRKPDDESERENGRECVDVRQRKRVCE